MTRFGEASGGAVFLRSLPTVDRGLPCIKIPEVKRCSASSSTLKRYHQKNESLNKTLPKTNSDPRTAPIPAAIALTITISDADIGSYAYVNPLFLLPSPPVYFITPAAKVLIGDLQSPTEPIDEPIYQECDAGNWDSLLPFLKRGVQEFGRIDIVVPNAGFGGPRRFPSTMCFLLATR